MREAVFLSTWANSFLKRFIYFSAYIERLYFHRCKKICFNSFFQDVELLYELIDEKDSEVKHLRDELKNTQECFDEVQSNMNEAQMIISEQQEQLAIYRQEVAVSKTNMEALKVRDVVVVVITTGFVVYNTPPPSSLLYETCLRIGLSSFLEEL